MFWLKAESVKIDGKTYDLSNAAQIDHFTCKMHLWQNIWTPLEDGGVFNDLDSNNYVAWRKEFVKSLKEFDKLYVKHEKTTNKEFMGYINEAFMPLTELWEANNNYYNLNKMVEAGVNVPEFRTKAVEDKFIEKMMKFMDVLKAYGSL